MRILILSSLRVEKVYGTLDAGVGGLRHERVDFLIFLECRGNALTLPYTTPGRIIGSSKLRLAHKVQVEIMHNRNGSGPQFEGSEMSLS